MKSRWQKIPLGEIENYILYFGLIVIILLDFAGSFIPVIRNYLQDSIPTYIVILLVFRLLTKDIKELKQNLPISGSITVDFNTQIKSLFPENAQLKQLDILGTSTRKIYHALEDLNYHVDEVRILIHEQLPNKDNAINRWKIKQRKGIFGKIEIRSYSTFPVFYAIIVNQTKGCFGFFQPLHVTNLRDQLSAMQATGPYLISQNRVDQAMLNDIQDWFDELFEHHSKQVYKATLITNEIQADVNQS
jgi:hypothetical protein